MAQEILTYHPPKKEPSFFNMYTFIGAIAGAGNPMGALFGAMIGGMVGYNIEKHQQEYGIKAKKPDGSILNSTAVMGALGFGLLAYGIVTLAAMAATTAVVTTVVGVGALAGGALGGWAQSKENAAYYNLALKQENERQAAVNSGKEVSQYKNIPDLPAVPQQNQATSQGRFAEQVKSTGQYTGTGIN